VLEPQAIRIIPQEGQFAKLDAGWVLYPQRRDRCRGVGTLHHQRLQPDLTCSVRLCEALSGRRIVEADFDAVDARRCAGVDGQPIVIDDRLARRPEGGQARAPTGLRIALADDVIPRVQ
jgi:hypothetical protein